MDFSFIRDHRWKDLDQSVKQEMLSLAFQDEIEVDPRWAGLPVDTQSRMKGTYFQDAADYESEIYAPEPEPRPEGILGALTSGGKQALKSVATTAGVWAGDAEEAKKTAAELSQIPVTSEQEQFQTEFQQRVAENDPGAGAVSQALNAVGDFVAAAWENPEGALHMMVSQTPNMAPTFAGMWAGAKAGTLLTAPLPIPWARVVGATAGAIVGMFLGNTAIETGYIASEDVAKGEYDREAITEKGLKKAAGVTAFDVAAMGVTKLIFTPAARAMSKASQQGIIKALEKEGLSGLDDIALQATLRNDAALRSRVFDAGAKAATEAAPKGVKNVLAHSAALGVETVSEGGGEYLGQVYAGMEPSISDAVMEAMSAGPTSIAGVAIGKSLAKGRDYAETLRAASEPSPGIQAATTADEALDTFQKGIDETLTQAATPGDLSAEINAMADMAPADAATKRRTEQFVADGIELVRARELATGVTEAERNKITADIDAGNFVPSEILAQHPDLIPEGQEIQSVPTKPAAKVWTQEEVDKLSPPALMKAAQEIGITDIENKKPKEIRAEIVAAQTPQVHDYTSTQVDLPAPEAKEITAFAAKIPDEALYTEPNDDSYGRETEPHITVKYGLKTNDPADVAPIISNHSPITAKMGKVSLFEGEKYDVVKVEVDSTELKNLNKKIAAEADISLPEGESFEYTPHVTIAYVKPGEGKKYVADNTLEGKEIVFDTITVSTKDGKKHQIKMEGAQSAEYSPRTTMAYSKAKPSPYFDITEDALDVPLADIKPRNPITTKEDQEKLVRGKEKMLAAKEGTDARRAPIQVYRRADGQMVVIDGNTTYHNLKELGEVSVPVVIKKTLKQQNVKNLDDVYAQAEEAKPVVEKMTEDFAAETGGTAHFRPNKALKGRARAEEKVGIYGTFARLKDIIASTIAFKNEAQMRKALKSFEEKHAVMELKDRFRQPIPTGYKDISMTVRMPNGHLTEVQFSTDLMVEAKNGAGHVIYDLLREVKSLKRPGAQAIDDRLTKLSNDFYSASSNALSSEMVSEVKSISEALGEGAMKTLLSPSSLNNFRDLSSQTKGVPSESKNLSAINVPVLDGKAELPYTGTVTSEQEDVKSKVWTPEEIKSLNPVALRKLAIETGVADIKNKKAAVIRSEIIAAQKKKGVKDALPDTKEWNESDGESRQQQQQTLDRFAKQIVEDGTAERVRSTSKAHKALKRIGELFGLKAVFWKSDSQVINEYNGFTHPTKPEIYINVDGAAPMAFTIGHETLHQLKENHKDLYDFLVDTIIVPSDAFKAYKKKFDAARKGTPAETKDPKAIMEELVADFAGDQFKSPVFWQKMHEKNASFTERIIDIIMSIIDKIVFSKTEGTQYIANFKESQDALVNAMSKFAKRQAEATGNNIKFSFNTMDKWRKVAEGASNKMGLDPKVVTRDIQKIEMIGQLLQRRPELLEEEGIGNPIRDNADYGKTFDLNTNCPLRFQYKASILEIEKQLGRLMSSDEMLGLGQLLESQGKVAPCIYCYVEAARRAFRNSVLKYEGIRRTIVEILESDPEASVSDLSKWATTSKGVATNLKKEFAAAAEEGKTPPEFTTRMIADPEYGALKTKQDSRVGDVISTAVKYAQASSFANSEKSYDAYSGQFFRMVGSKSRTESQARAGWRWFSSTDAQVNHIVDYMQAVTDLSILGDTAHLYTKQPWFVDIFGATNIRINMSVFADGTTAETVASNESYGMNWKDAERLSKKFENAAGMMMATSDAQIEWALGQDWIDMIIPWHRSGMTKEQATALNWTDYTSVQSERWISPAEHKGDHVPHFVFDDHKNSKSLYLKKCKDAGVRPRFEAWVDHPNYMKLVTDTVRPDVDQSPVQPKFNWAMAEKVIKDWQAADGYSLEAVADQKVVQDMMQLLDKDDPYWGVLSNRFSELKKEEPPIQIASGVESKIKFSKSPSVGSKAFKKWFKGSVMVDKDGEPSVLYHGTKELFDAFKATRFADRLIFFSTNSEFASKWAMSRNKKVEDLRNFKWSDRAEKDLKAHWAEFYKTSDELYETDKAEWIKQYDALRKTSPPSRVAAESASDAAVYPVYMKATKVFDPRQDYKLVEDTLKSMSSMEGIIKQGTHKEGHWIVYENEQVINKLEKLGYDAILLRESAIDDAHEMVAVWNPAQIKSVFNKGTWDAKDPRIKFSKNVGSPEFKTWSKGYPILEDSDISDAVPGKGTVVKVYHGTTNIIEVFDPTVKGSKEGYFGQVNYFTSSRDDAEQHYEGKGPDLTRRIDDLADLLSNMDEEQAAEWAQDHNFDPDEVLAAKDNINALEQIADDYLTGPVEETMEMYVRLDNPVVIGSKRDQNWIDVYDIDEDQIRQDAIEEGLTEDELEERIYEERDGADNKILDALTEAIRETIGYEQGAPDGIAQDIMEQMEIYDTEISATELHEQLISAEALVYMEDENGNLVANHVAARVFKHLGYDSIILANADKTFPGMKMEPGTSHVHVFKETPSQMKATVSEFTEDPRIKFSKSSKEPTNILTKAFERWFGKSKVVDKDGKPLVVYHGTFKEEDFSEFKVGYTGVIYAAEDPQYASAFAGAGGKNPKLIEGIEVKPGKVLPLYLKLERPLDFTAFGAGNISGESLASFLKDNGIKIWNTTRGLSFSTDYVWSFLRSKSAINNIKDAGFDGIVFNEDEANQEKKSYMFFNPTQVKSATGNSGAFDPKNPDIRYSKSSKEPTPLITKPMREFHKKLMDDLSEKSAEMNEKIREESDRFVWDRGDRIRSQKTGKMYRIESRLWDRKNDRPMYKYSSLDEDETGTFIADLAHKAMDKMGQLESVKFSKSPVSEQADKWYSALVNAVENVKQKTMPAKMWVSLLESNKFKQAGVKQDEIEWSGVKDWLEGKGKVTKQEVLDYLSENNVRVEEVVKEKRKVKNIPDEVVQRWTQLGEWSQSDRGLTPEENEEFRRINTQVSTSRGLTSEVNDTKFSGYLSPWTDVEGYKEILMTLPVKPENFDFTMDEDKYGIGIKVNGAETDYEIVFDDDGTFTPANQGQPWDETYKTKNEAFEAIKEDYVAELKRNIQRDDIAYKSPPAHQYGDTASDTNRLVHMRIGERMVDGKRVMHVFEIQSDWAAEGRKKGFKSNRTIAEVQKLRSKAFAEDNKEEGIKLRKELDILEQGGGVPKAPFVDSTGKYVTLAMKRLVRMAAENNFDMIVFDNGQIQADRYDLSKHLSKIDYEQDSDGSNNYDFVAVDKKGEEVLSEEDITIERIEELVGKDIAEKIKNKDGKKTHGEFESGYREWRTLDGLDLKVGGEGMKGFYDSILPAEINKFFNKKAWGNAKVELEGVEAETTPQNYSPGAEWKVTFGNGEFVTYRRTEEQAKELVDMTNELGRYTDATYEKMSAVPTAKLHALPITAEMKSKAMTEGMPLFSKSKILDQADQPITQEDYDHVLVDTKTLKQESIAGVVAARRDARQQLDKFFGSISTRLANIMPELRSHLRKMEFGIGTQGSRLVKAVMPLLNKTKKMTREDFSAWDYARKNSDIPKIQELIKKYDLAKEYAAYRGVLDKVKADGIAVGLDVGTIEEYAPRILKDATGYLEATEQGKDWPVIQKALNAKAASLGLQVSELTLDQRADLISNMLLGGATGLGGLSATKARKLTKIPKELNKFYMDSDAALIHHIYSMTQAIEARKFFGKIPEKVAKIKNRLAKLNAEIVKMRKNPDPNAEQIDAYDDVAREYYRLINVYANQRDFSANIGAYVDELLINKKIDGSQQQELIEILTARFHEKGMHGVLQAYKNLSYIDTMGSITSAVTQIGDLAWSMYENGMIRTLKHMGKAALKRSRITKEDVGVERIAQEFADGGMLSNAVTKVFKLTGLEYIDAIGKETLLNASLEKFQADARKNPGKLKNKIRNIFEGEADSVIQDLLNNDITDNVKLLVYNKLLDFQPVALSEMPQKYLEAGNGRLFYMLKSFTLKQFDIYRREIYHNLASPDKATKLEGMKNLVMLSAFFVIANAGADEIKDWILGRETDFEDRVVDNMLRLGGISKFVTWKARTEGVGSAALKQIIFPVKFLDSLYKDVYNMGDDKGLETLASVPLVGKLAYWHMGRGTSKREDLWTIRFRKEKQRLNKINDRYEKSKDKTAFRAQYSKDLMDLRRINAVQGRLNTNRKLINRYKAKESTPVYKQKIKELEDRRIVIMEEYLNKEK